MSSTTIASSRAPGSTLPRKLLCFESFPLSGEITRVMTDAGWDVHRVQHAEQIPELSEDFDFRIGIASVDSQSAGAEQATPLGRYISSRSAMRWIAIVRPEELQTPSVCRLVANRFDDYHTIPVDPQRLVHSLGHTLGMAELSTRSRSMADRLMARQGLLGASPVVQDVISQIKKSSQARLPVLLRGEIGSGKATAAELVHRWSPQHDSPFVHVQCAFLEKTGGGGDAERTAQLNQEIASAAGGTLFLDNVDELAESRQLQLLQILQRMEQASSVDGFPTRIIGATHREDDEGTVPGLMLKLGVISITLPPLRDRRSDIEPLTRHILNERASEAGVQMPEISRRAIQALEHHQWTGNVRELTNCVQRALLMCDSGEIRTEDLGLSLETDTGNLQTLEGARAFAEREAILCALTRTDGNVTRAAQELAVSRASLHRLIHKHSVKY